MWVMLVINGKRNGEDLNWKINYCFTLIQVVPHVEKRKPG